MDSLTKIKVHATKCIELALIESCDNYLFPEDDSFGMMMGMNLTGEEDPLDSIREDQGLAKRGKLGVKEQLFVTLKDFASKRYLNSFVFIKQIFVSLATRLE